MTNIHLEEKKEIKLSYIDHINDLIVYRLQKVLPVGMVIQLAFYAIDRFAYPFYSLTFLKIRLISTCLLIPILIASYNKEIKPYIVWLVDIGGLFFIIALALMVLITDGSSNRYYQGVNLAFLGIVIINPFYIKHVIITFLMGIGIFDFAMLYHHSNFNLLNFSFANYFMSSTALLVAIMTKFYKDQHYKAFERQEQLKINEETLTFLYAQADQLSKIDSLTETNNRRHFSKMLNNKIDYSEKNKSSFYLVIFDVDFFKEINDAHGHNFGDKVLVNVVNVVKSNIRSNDFIGRFGGDEFVICLDHPTKEALLIRLTKIRNSIRNLNLMDNNKVVPISTSIGAAKFIPGTGMNEEKLMETADIELFNVKNTSRGEISINQ